MTRVRARSAAMCGRKTAFFGMSSIAAPHTARISMVMTAKDFMFDSNAVCIM